MSRRVDQKPFRARVRASSVLLLLTTGFCMTGCAGFFFGKEARDFIEVADIAQVPESDPFTRSQTRIENDSLKFIASYGGGCREHVFTLYAARAKDSANTGLLYIQHNANNDLCRAVINDDTVSFGLTGLKSALNLKSSAALVIVPDQTGADSVFALTY